MTDIYLELGNKRIFACAYDWPGWCRSGGDEASALEALANYLPRYLPVVKEAGLRAPNAQLEVVDRVKGSSNTDFGVPHEIAPRDLERLTPASARRLAGLVRASWSVFDRVVARAPAELRKGPRGGGRDRDKIVDHVYGAESAYASRAGVRLRQPELGDSAAVKAFRDALSEALEHPLPEAKWPAPYAARRIAWHALDHAWEIEDRSTLDHA